MLASLVVFASVSQGDENDQYPFEQAIAPLDQAKLKEMLNAAEKAERRFDWEKACGYYEDILRLDRNLPEVRTKYVHAVRRIWQVRRHRDDGYRKEVLSLDYGQSVKLYNSVIETLVDNSLDGKDKQYSALLQKGVEELWLALAEPTFVQQHLPRHAQAEVGEFRELLQRKWGSASPTSRLQLTKQVREIALAAQGKLQLSPAVTILELASGACYAFDDYTAYLTPNQLQELYDSLKGDYAGIVGINLTTAPDGKIVVRDIVPGTSAAELDPPLEPDDHVVSIGKKVLVPPLTAQTATELFDGPAGTTVDLEVHSRTLGMRSITLRRRALSTVGYEMRGMVGYLRITAFHESTLHDVDEALMNLTKSNMKALVLDLRRNSGGLFDVAVEVARRFLSDGVVVSTQTSRGTTILHARNPGALGVPLVVLVDSDTASSAEVLAGALKDRNRGRLIGEATFGKGCTQSIFRLPASSSGVATGGLRITVGRFFSPEGVPYSGRGVTPHVVVERMSDSSMLDPHLIDEAVLEAQRLVAE